MANSVGPLCPLQRFTRCWLLLRQAFLELVAHRILGVQGNLWMASSMAVAVFHKIRCDSVKPRQESLIGIELRAVLINADEGFLRRIGSVFFVLQTADKVMKQLPGVALHEFVECRAVTGGKTGHV